MAADLEINSNALSTRLTTNAVAINGPDRINGGARKMVA